MTKYKDPFKDIRASLTFMSDPLKEHREMLASISDPIKDLRANMALISDPLKEHRDMMASISDPMKDLRANMALMSDPLKEHRDMMASLSDPMKDLRATMTLMSDPLKEHREMMASISDPMKSLRDSMTLAADPLKEHREMLASISDPMKDLRDSMTLVADPLKEHREMLASFLNPMKELRKSIALISDPFSEIQKTITDSASLKSIRDIAFEVRPDIEIDSQGTITLATKRIAASELQELSDNIFQNSSLTETSSLEESINNLVNEIRNQKDPLIQKILMCFIYPLIIIVIASFINPVVDHHVKSYLNSDKRALTKELKATVNATVDNKDVLKSLRYVSADVLNVRASATVKSETIGYLRFSSTVLVIEKRKNWTLVEWHDPETEAQITGWVFTRYLERFR
ncbi:SH3 domain-containing protein [Alteromonas sp. Cnat3-28]|uniref:SH3 domain-containing protein n=1 Tax=Alteromonas sp. Cnat3-28 TaxID=2917729 RepID=UPI001EF72AB6|nr:SH3 domain-containing protein [Alteromonas sp. Cnat3-28]MCG7645068.1 SH3 domain-containing protein [Alteromonas sp. Cnat3-28]